MITNKTLGGVLLITGTCVGAGMLALPVSTAKAGFVASIVLLFICWFIMYLTGLMVLKVRLWLPHGANFVSMARATIGRTGEVITWLTYLLLLYSLMAAYLSGGGDLLFNALPAKSQMTLPHWTGTLPWLLLVGIMVYLGALCVDGLNRLFITGLVIAYIVLVVLTLPHIHGSYLYGGQPFAVLVALPIFLASFGYHVIVPGMTDYLSHHKKRMRKIILFGSLMPLIVYLLWALIIFGTIPRTGTQGLLAILQSGQPATQLTHSLATLIDSHWVAIGARFFIFFALASSFLGIAFSLFDFIADGFNIPKTIRGKLVIALITFIPPFIYAYAFPRGFILALSYAGIFVAILHGILPSLMVWRGHSKGLAKEKLSLKQHLGLSVVMVFSLVVIVTQIVIHA